MKTSNALLPLLHAYFHDWIAGQRSASRHTILSYRDTWRLFLRFVAKRNQSDVARLTLADLSDQQVLAFLDDLEKTHGRTISTRNCRLAALRSFFEFVADRDPLAAGQCAAVLRIPNKRTPKRTSTYLESEELGVLMAQPDRKTKLGERDHVLLAVLYNTGARIAEALNVRLSDIRLDSPAQVRVWGKGCKERISPLWPETVELLVAFLKRNPVGLGEVIFRNRYGNPLGASGVRFRLKRYLQAAAQKAPRLCEKRVSPHTLRHTAAVHLLASGVDVTISRDWMGHVSLDTVAPREQGTAEMMVNLYRTYSAPLSEEMIFGWHRMSMGGRRDVNDVGCYRTSDEPMQVVSGVIGAPKVHFEAPPSAQVPREMAGFIDWFKHTAPGGTEPLPAPTRAGAAHLYFESIHPFEDGNGRVGRAIAEKSLAENLGQPTLIVLAATILARRESYYHALEAASRQNEITSWLAWFGGVTIEAQRRTLALIEFLIAKAKLFDRLKGQLNERQKKTLLRMFKEGIDGFKGGLSAGKYSAIRGLLRQRRPAIW